MRLPARFYQAEVLSIEGYVYVKLHEQDALSQASMPLPKKVPCRCMKAFADSQAAAHARIALLCLHCAGRSFVTLGHNLWLWPPVSDNKNSILQWSIVFFTFSKPVRVGFTVGTRLCFLRAECGSLATRCVLEAFSDVLCRCCAGLGKLREWAQKLRWGMLMGMVLQRLGILLLVARLACR